MEPIKQYQILLRKARVDLTAARLLLEAESKELDFDVSLFHLQQSAEKAIKAVLSYRGIHYTKTHDIEHLLMLCRDNELIFSVNEAALISLSDYAVEGRYDTVSDDIKEVETFLFLIENLHAQIDKLLEL